MEKEEGEEAVSFVRAKPREEGNYLGRSNCWTLDLLYLSLFRRSTRRRRKREKGRLRASTRSRQTSQSARKVPVNYLSATVRRIASIKVSTPHIIPMLGGFAAAPGNSRFPSPPPSLSLLSGETDPFFRPCPSLCPRLRDVYGARRTERAFLRSRGGRRGGLEDRSADIFQRRNPLLLEDNFWEGGRDSYWVGFLSFLASRWLIHFWRCGRSGETVNKWISRRGCWYPWMNPSRAFSLSLSVEEVIVRRKI